jgi:hypothetical protein
MDLDPEAGVGLENMTVQMSSGAVERPKGEQVVVDVQE